MPNVGGFGIIIAHTHPHPRGVNFNFLPILKELIDRTMREAEGMILQRLAGMLAGQFPVLLKFNRFVCYIFNSVLRRFYATYMLKTF